MERKTIVPYISILLVTAASMGISKTGQHIASGLLLLMGAVFLYIYFFRNTGSLVNFKGLLVAFFMGGEGIAAFQLSHLQTEWSGVTWLCFMLFMLAFLLGYDGKEFLDAKRYGGEKLSRVHNSSANDKAVTVEGRLLKAIAAVALVSFAAFLLEVCILGYVPLFSKDTHAYNYFHVSGVHYFTVTCMMVHALTLIHWMVRRKRGGGKLEKKQMALLAVSNGLALSIAILCISKFQFLLTVALPLLIYLMMKKDIRLKRILAVGGGICVLGAAVMVFMIMRRNYAPGYLNGIFEMKDPSLPMFIQYPYMYIANNYANFNCLVQQMTGHTFGLRMAFPVFALTGLKFLSPFREWLSLPVYLTKTELNTLTIIYDAYYDFGVPGVFLLGAVLGAVCAFLARKMREDGNPVIYLFGGQMAMYLVLSFFSTWFSLPTTWFWLAVTVVLYWYVGGTMGGRLGMKHGRAPERGKRRE